MTQTETKRGFQFLYFTEFKWIDIGQKDYFGGEPNSSRVYKAIDDSKLFWRIPLGDSGGIALEKDQTINEDHDQWSCDYVEITKKNLLDLDICLDDLKGMRDALRDPLADFTTTHNEGDDFVVHGEERAEEERSMSKEAHKKLITLMKESLKELRAFDMDHYETMIALTTMISEALATPSHIALTDGIAWSEKTGKIANITMATQNLESYLNTNKAGAVAASDLIDAIYSITIEIIRLKKGN